MDLDNNINLTLQVTCPWRRAWQPTPVFLPGESPWTEEPGGLESMGSQRVGHDWATKHTARLYKISLGISLLVLSSISLFNFLLVVVQSVISNSLWPHGLQHARLPCPSPSPRVCSNSCPLSWWCHPAISFTATPPHPPPPLIFPIIRVFFNELAFCIRWPKYCSFSTSPCNEYSGLISFRMDWFDLFAVLGTLKSPLQHHGLKALILWHSAFFMVQFSHPYTTTRKPIALTRRTFVDKVMSLLF